MNEQMNKLMIWNGLNFQMIIKYISDRLVTLKMTIVLFYACCHLFVVIVVNRKRLCTSMWFDVCHAVMNEAGRSAGQTNS